ncbi:MAG: methyltransferase domain-containing protein [Bacteroidetes bacterium]|jgi:SAM-dependent methyltransferase|nr:methyltransferase domain-containing protein [Bacteroidota bacterium]
MEVTAAPSTYEIGTTGLAPNYRYDLRTTPPDVFVDASETDFRTLAWADLGRPYQVDNYSRHRKSWEAEHDADMPVEVQWQHFNKHFHSLFVKAPDEDTAVLRERFTEHVKDLDLGGAFEVIEELVQLKVWNHVHRVEDAVWDPRGKRALFEGLDVERPNILFLGAADGYEAMQLLSMYPGGHAVLVDYDPFCKTERFGNFPAAYPFLGTDPATGNHRVYHREDFDIDFVVEDIRDLDYGREFDVVISVGLVEHFPDEYKPLAFDFHRRFLKPGGYAIMTTPRRQVRSLLFYRVMGNLMNYGYRELMDARQLGLYAYENGFDVLRCGHIKAHNGVVTKAR